MRVLVTGAPGWIGRRLVRDLLVAGHAVRCLVQPGIHPAALAREVEVVRGDVRDASAAEAAVAGAEAVVHCAAVIHPRWAHEFQEVNGGGTKHVVEAAAAAGARRLVHVSSNAAAGFQRERDLLLTEDDVPLPKGGYGRSKLEAERAVLAAGRAGRIETVIIRPCRCYGPGLPERVERVFRMVREGRVPIFGSGLALRSMTYVGDLVRVLTQCLDDPAAVGETFWVADEVPCTTLGAFEAMASAAGVPLRVRRFPESLAHLCEMLDLAYERLGGYSMSLHLVGESHRNIGCSIEKARRVLRFEPRNDLVGGYREALGQSSATPLQLAA